MDEQQQVGNPALDTNGSDLRARVGFEVTPAPGAQAPASAGSQPSGGTAPSPLPASQPPPVATPSLPGASNQQAPSVPTTPTVTRRPRQPLPIKKIGLSLLILAIISVVIVTAYALTNRKSLAPANVSSRFPNVQISLSDLAANNGLSLLGAKSLVVNGQLRANEAFIITPSAKPTGAESGQIYYDKNSNELAYYNGSRFVALSDASKVVQSIGGQSGLLTVGAGLSANAGQITNTGVLSVQGQTGAVTLTAGNGITIDGTTISGSGVNSLGGQNGDITLGDGLSISGGELKNAGIISATAGSGISVTDDGSGNITIAATGGGGTVGSPGGTTGKIAKFTGVQTIADSLLSESGSVVTVTGSLSVTSGLTLGTALTVGNGGTGATSLTNNGVVIGQGTGALTAITAGGSGLCLVSTSGAPAFSACPGSGGVSSLNSLTGALTLANASGVGSTVTIDDASTSAKGIASFNSTNFTVSSGAVNTIQNIATGSTPTFAGVNTNAITPSSALTVGATGQSLTLQGNASTSLTATNSGSTTSLTFQTPTANVTYRLPTASAGTYDLCTSNGNCAGAGVTLQAAYNNSSNPEITVDATRGALTVRDASSAIGANLFEVQNNAGSTTYFGVTSSGASVTGTTTSTGNINTSGGGLQTNSTTRIDNSGNLTNIAALTLSGAISGGTTISGSGNINTTGGGLQTNSVTRIDNSGNLTNIAAITASGNLVLQGGSATLGTTSQAGTLAISDGSSNTGSIVTTSLAADRTYTLPDASGTICLTTGNCAGSGSGVTTSGGSTNRLAKFSGSQAIDNSTITDDGSTVTTSVDLVIQGGDATIGVAASQTGTLNFAHSGSSFLGSIVQGSLSGNRTYTLPDASGTFCLTSGNCSGSGSANTLQAAYDAGNTISTSSSRDIAITLANNSNMTVATSAGATGFTTFSLSDGSNASPPAQLVLVKNNDTNQALAVGVSVQSAAGGITTAFDASGSNITNALAIGAHAITGTNFSVTSAGAVTAASTINGQTISSAANFTGTLAVTGNTTLTGDIAVNGGDITSTGALNITPGGTLTVGATSQTLALQGDASTSLSATSGGITNSLVFATPASSNKTLTLPNETGTICTTGSVCTGYAPASGSANYIQNGTSLQAASNFHISGTGNADTSFTAPLFDTASAGALAIGTTNATGINLNQSTALAAGKNLTFASGAGNFDQSASSGTHATGTGAVSLNGATTVANNKSFTAGGDALFKDATNSATAFQIQNATGAQLFALDTTADSTNLVTNGGFEVDTSGWTARTGCTPSRSTAQQLYGAASGSCVNTATAGAGFNYNLTLSATTTYAISFYAKGSSGFSTLDFGYAPDGSTETTFASTGNSVSSTSWTRYTLSFTTGAISGTPYFFIKQSDTTARTIFIDGVRIETGSNQGAYRESRLNLNGTISSPLAVQPAVDSNTAFAVYSNSGNQVLTVSTINSRVGIGVANPGARLQVRSGDSALPVAILTATSGQTSDILQLQDTNSNVNAAFNATGNQLTLGRIAGSGTVTQGKLVLSDGTTDNFGLTLQSTTLTGNRTITFADATGTVCLDSGNCAATLQSAYAAGNTIATSDARNISISLADTTTDSSMIVNLQCTTCSASGGRFAVQNGGSDVLTVSPNSAGITIGNNTLNTPVTIDSGTGTIGIGTGAQARTVNLGTGAAAQTVTVGSTTGASATTVQGGSANMTMSTSGGIDMSAVTADITATGSQVASQGFEGVTFPPASPGTWTTGGSVNWVRTTGDFQEGAASATSTNTVPNSGSAYLDLDYTFGESGSLKFYWKVSSEANFDYLFLCVDDDACSYAAPYTRITGSVGWTEVTVPVSAGAHSFRWTYVKDSGGTAGSDMGWVDNVRIYEGSRLRVDGNLAVTGVVAVGLSATASTSAVCSSLAAATAPTANTSYDLRDCSSSPAADFAEMYPAASDVEVGDVVSYGSQLVDTYEWSAQSGEIDWNRTKGKVSQVVKGTTPYNSKIMGVVSDNYLDFVSTGYNIKEADNPTSIALVGRVLVKVTTENGPIEPGDFLTASATRPGYAMKATGAGQVIGQALAPFAGSEPGRVMVFVRPGYSPGDPVVGASDLQNGSVDNLSVAHLTVTGDLQITGTALFRGKVSVADIDIDGHIRVGHDTAGTVTIPVGQASATVAFRRPYEGEPPVITTSTSDFVLVKVVNKTINGFTITIAQPAVHDITIDWTALQPKTSE